MPESNSDRLTRRQVLIGTAGLAAAGALGLQPTRGASAASPRKGGTFRYAVVGAATSDALDPATLTDIAPGIMSWQSRNNLVEIGPNSSLEPELAESWEPAEGGAKWIFKLRRGVEFHNGKTLDLQDVIFSIDHHRGASSKSAAKPFVEPIVEMKADGKDTLVVTLNEPNADFPYVMADYHLQIVPAGTTKFDDGMGTGPYRMKAFEPGVRCTGVRNPNYWKSGHANFDEVECLAIADSTARLNALMGRRIDALMFLDLKLVDAVKKSPDTKVIEVPGGTHMTMPMNVKLAPFNDRDVRLALKYAIDREQLVRTILLGHGEVANDQPISPLNPFYAKETPQHRYDPDKAKSLIKKAGHDSLKVQLSASNAILGMGIDVATLYRQAATAAGIQIEVVREPADGYWSNVWEKKPWCQSYFGARPTADLMFSLAYVKDAPWNETFWNSERFDQLLKLARRELDQAKRTEIYREMQILVSEDGGSVIPFFVSTIDAASSKIQTSSVASNFNLDGGRAADRWWFAE